MYLDNESAQVPDTATKNYVERNDVFSDLFNLALLNMDAKVEQSSLKPMPSRMMGKREMDVVKKGKVLGRNGACEAILFAECQTNVDYSMPIRMMAYEADIFRKDVSKRMEENRRKKLLKKGGEYISGLRKDEQITMVLGIVAYWGEKAWDGHKALSEMLPLAQCGGPSYELRLVEIMRLMPEEIDGFSSDLKEVVLFMQNRNDIDKIDKLMEENMKYKRMSAAGAEVLKSLASIDINVDEGKEEIDVCKAWTDQKERGILIGRNEGIGIGENMKAIRMIINMYDNGLDVSAIAIIAEKPETEVLDILNNRDRQL